MLPLLANPLERSAHPSLFVVSSSFKERKSQGEMVAITAAATSNGEDVSPCKAGAADRSGPLFSFPGRGVDGKDDIRRLVAPVCIH